VEFLLRAVAERLDAPPMEATRGLQFDSLVLNFTRRADQ
jgi:hypothetical protein